MQVERTNRGFEFIGFEDANGELCSLQQSSAIDDTKRGLEQPGSSMLWLGPCGANPRIMASQATRFGVNTTETTGWVPYPVSSEVLMTTRMHLRRDHVVELMKHLQQWLDSGSLEVAE